MKKKGIIGPSFFNIPNTIPVHNSGGERINGSKRWKRSHHAQALTTKPALLLHVPSNPCPGLLPLLYRAGVHFGNKLRSTEPSRCRVSYMTFWRVLPPNSFLGHTRAVPLLSCTYKLETNKKKKGVGDGGHPLSHMCGGDHSRPVVCPGKGRANQCISRFQVASRINPP